MEYVIAFAISILFGLGIATILRIRFKRSSVDLIYRNIAATIFILLFSFLLFYRLGFNVWTAVIIPLASLVSIFFLVRDAVNKLLDTH